MERSKITTLESRIKKDVIDLLISGSKDIFTELKDVTSFGWSQLSDKGDHTKRVTVAHTINQPDVSGAIGTMIIPSSKEGVTQELISDFLKQFKIELLLVAFGEMVEVTIYKDLTFEVHKV